MIFSCTSYEIYKSYIIHTEYSLVSPPLWNFANFNPCFKNDVVSKAQSTSSLSSPFSLIGTPKSSFSPSPSTSNPFALSGLISVLFCFLFSFFFQLSPFFTEQLTAFEEWLERVSEHKKPPKQLPIVLQVEYRRPLREPVVDESRYSFATSQRRFTIPGLVEITTKELRKRHHIHEAGIGEELNIISNRIS